MILILCSVIAPMYCGAVFEPFQDAKTNIFLPKVAFVAINLAALGLGLWKVRFLISHFLFVFQIAVFQYFQSFPCTVEAFCLIACISCVDQSLVIYLNETLIYM